MCRRRHTKAVEKLLLCAGGVVLFVSNCVQCVQVGVSHAVTWLAVATLFVGAACLNSLVAGVAVSLSITSTHQAPSQLAERIDVSSSSERRLSPHVTYTSNTQTVCCLQTALAIAPLNKTLQRHLHSMSVNQLSRQHCCLAVLHCTQSQALSQQQLDGAGSSSIKHTLSSLRRQPE